MRPNNEVEGQKVYECFVCGERAETDTGGTCSACGGELCHLGRSRDL